MTENIRVALYGRVSTDKQNYDNQVNALKEYAKKNGWTIYKVYSEVISGKESEREEFKKMFADAEQRKFDAILVWALDRFTREGTEKVWQYLTRLKSLNIKFISYQEPYFNTDNELVRDVLFSIMGALAKQERLRISERVRAGLVRAKSLGHKSGKPEIPIEIKEQIIACRKEGKTFKQIQQEVFYWTKGRNKKNVSMGFINKVLKEFAV